MNPIWYLWLVISTSRGIFIFTCTLNFCWWRISITRPASASSRVKITFLIKIWKYWRKAADPPTNVSIKLYLALTISNSDTKYYFLLISCKMSVYYTYSSYSYLLKCITTYEKPSPDVNNDTKEKFKWGVKIFMIFFYEWNK